uniref:Uncharacterized protein n=1 Tax=Entomoneis paludosa TaxID=265537 RepID=A0A7S2YTQ7_9STRA|mmetsp:Transcript_9847/g.20367  ORF Transcript_9847/g.20367 Transcript_9847/m.20367 type:complete len:140 (+) Transcript_9847:89-508(+)
MATSSVFRLMEALVPRGARRTAAPNAWAVSSLWRPVFEGEEAAAQEAANAEARGEESTEETIETPIRNEQNTQIRNEFVHEMRLRDAHGVSLRTNAHDPVLASATSASPLAAAMNMPQSMPNLSVPSAPGSSDYIYLPQ